MYQVLEIKKNIEYRFDFRKKFTLYVCTVVLNNIQSYSCSEIDNLTVREFSLRLGRVPLVHLLLFSSGQ